MTETTAPPPSPAPAPPPVRERRGRDVPLTWLLLGTAVAYFPFALLGYGTDIDVDAVLRAGRFALDGDYEPGRAPGAAPFELAVGALDRVGGAFAVNAASVAFALLALWAVHRLLEHDGARWPGLAALVLAVNPWFWIASTSLGEMTWAVALVLAGAVAATRDRRLLAGVLFGLAVGCRASLVVAVVAWLVAERTGAASARPRWSTTARTAGVAVLVVAACFVPAWLDAGRSFDFLDRDLDFEGWGIHFGRFLVKNLATATILGAAVLVVGVRSLVLEAVHRRRLSLVVRFALGTVVLTELLFFRFPYKPVHLLPVVAGVALLAGAAARADRRWLVALVVAQLVSGLVGSTIAEPDQADGRESGRIALRPADGALVNDLRCRLDDVDRGTWIDGDTRAEREEAEARADANWTCQRDAWRDS
jgi:hypothetical protein